MTQNLHSFVQLFFIGFIALFPAVNPIGSAFIVNPYFSDLSHSERINSVKKITFYAFCICVVTMFAGHWILELFGLSVPVVKLAGGIMICKIGWNFLSPDKPDQDKTDQVPGKDLENITDKLFYPITFPITTGPGSIAVLFTLSAHASDEDFRQYLINSGALLASIISICVLIFLLYVNANRFMNLVGTRNEKVINRFMAFLIFCVGLQIATGGIFSLLKLHMK